MRSKCARLERTESNFYEISIAPKLMERYVFGEKKKSQFPDCEAKIGGGDGAPAYGCLQESTNLCKEEGTVLN